MGQARKRTDHEQLRQQQAAKRHYQATMARFQESMKDRVKESLIEYLGRNPQWSVEDLKHMIKVLERHFGLINRYRSKEAPDDTGGPEEPTQDPS